MLTTSPSVRRSRPNRAAAAAALLCVLILTAVLGLQRSAVAQDEVGPTMMAEVVAQTAEIAASLDIDVVGNPRLYGAIAQVEKWSLEAEAEVERRQAVVELAENLADRLRLQLDTDEVELAFIAGAAQSEQLTAAVVEMRDQRPLIEDKIERQSEALAAAEARHADEVEQLGHDLDELIEIWSARQRILSDLTIQLSRPGGQTAIGGRQFDGALTATPLSDEALADRVLAQMAAAQQVDAAATYDLWLTDDEPADNDEFVVVSDYLGSAVASEVEMPVLRWPAIGAVNSGFGMRVHPIYRRSIMHTGIDIDAPWGDPVLSVGDGIVTEAHWKGGYGNAVVVDHGAGVTSLYSHLAELHVQPGDAVSTGGQLGLVGATGTATDAHLHFEVRVNNDPVDPLDYLP